MNFKINANALIFKPLFIQIFVEIIFSLISNLTHEALIIFYKEIIKFATSFFYLSQSNFYQENIL